MSKLKFFLSLVIIVIMIIVIWGGIEIYKETVFTSNNYEKNSKEEIPTSDNEKELEFITTSTNTNFEGNPGYNFQDMQGSNGLSYKRITTYEQYQEDLKKWPELVEMTAEDFNENFVIVIVGGNYHTASLEIENIATDEKNLVVDLKQKDKFDETSVLTVKLSKEYERENIILRNNPIVPTPTNKFVKLEDIPVGYSVEDAIEDGCFVIKYGAVVSEDSEAMDKFVEACLNDKEAFIRIYIYSKNENASIVDVEYKNGKISKCDKNVTQEGAQVGGYKSGYKINVRERENALDKKQYRIYELEDEIGNIRDICSITI